MKSVYRHHQKLPALYYRRIGEISHQWNMVEVYLQTIVWHFLDLDYKRGRLLTYWPGARSKVQIFRALTLRWIDDPELKDEIRSIAKQADTLNDDRNKIVHGIWGYKKSVKEQFLIHISNVRQRIVPSANLKTYEDLRGTANEIIALKRRLIALHKTLDVAIP